MAIYHFRAKRKPTGGLVRKFYRKTMRKFEMGRDPAKTTIGPKNLVKVQAKRSGVKQRLVATDVANVFDKKSGKSSKSKILDVVENKANPHFVRLKVITKGAVIKTEAGDARVTSRPGQDGVVNAILIEQAKTEAKAQKTKAKK